VPRTDATTGVLLMAYGTPASAEDLCEYYTHIRRGRPPTDDQLADLRRRYQAIGGVSPLLERTRSQARGVQEALDRAAPERFHVALGMKHARPFIEDGTRELIDTGAADMVGLVLAPHYSAMSIGEYIERAAHAAQNVRAAFVRSWHLAPGLIEVLAARVTEGLTMLPADSTVVFTAHSLPSRVVTEGDPYPQQVWETAAAVAARAGVKRWSQAWQSAGRTPDPWLGPDVCEVIAEQASDGNPGVLVCPVGFVADHLEVLYDLDVDAAQVAAQAGIAFARTRSLNDDPRFCAVVAEVVVEHAP
jgi:protoporphyrin/coproporphyrin ferrochelatase